MKSKPANEKISGIGRKAKQAYGYLLKLGNLSVGLAAIERLPKYGIDNSENDSEHSFHLALSATELAADYFPGLDVGLVSQFSLVHDMPEIYTGDVRTFNISKEERINKELAEKESLGRLLKEIPPYTAQLLSRYEKQQEPEARFVRLVDKIMPDIINVVTKMTDVYEEELNISSAEELRLICETRLIELQDAYPEFPLALIIKKLTLNELQQTMFK